MDDLFYDPEQDFMDDMALLFDRFERDFEGCIEPNPELPRDFEFTNAGTPSGTRPHMQVSTYDDVLDETDLMLDALEAWQEGQGGGNAQPAGVCGPPELETLSKDYLPDDTASTPDAPQPWQGAQGGGVYQPPGHKDVKRRKRKTPVYGSFKAQLPPRLEVGPQEHHTLRPNPPGGARSIGRKTGSRASYREGDGIGKSNGVEYWCTKRAELISELDDECEGCEEDCGYAWGGQEDEVE